MVHSGLRGLNAPQAHLPSRLLAALASLALMAPIALAQANGYDPPRSSEESVDDVNSLLGFVADDERAEDVLFPALADLEAPPGALTDVRRAAMMATNHPSWGVVRGWAQGEAQVAALDAMREITEFQTPFLFSFPYGSGASSEFADVGLSVTFGENNLLAMASFDYLDALDELAMLVHVEATRLAAAGEVGEALDLLVRLTRLGRITLDRVFAQEHYWGYGTMRLALERMRDIAYVFDESASVDDYADAVAELDPRDMALDRLEIPLGEKHAALQMIVETIEFRGEPNPDSFAPTLARMSAAERELRLFSQAARWDAIAENHKGWYETLDMLRGLYDDWLLRWKLSPHESISEMTEYQRMDKAYFAMLDEVIGDLEPLFAERLRLRLEAAGTRTALAVMAYHKRYDNWPSPLSAVRPRFIDEIDLDPFDPSESHKVDYLQYFVPVRDFRKNERVDPDPYVIDIVSGGADEAEAALVQQFVAVLQEILVETINNMSDEDIAAQRIDELVRILAEKGANAENLDEHFDEILALSEEVEDVDDGAAFYDAMRLAFSERGLPPEIVDRSRSTGDASEPESEEDREFTLQAFEGALSDERVSGVVNAYRGEVSVDDQRVVLLVLVQSLMRQGILETVGGEGGGFSVTLDDSTFVLYSLGSDGARNWAKTVGPGGADVLMWPPMMSLQRDR